MLIILHKMKFLGFHETPRYFTLLALVCFLGQCKNSNVDNQKLISEFKSVDFCNRVICDKVEKCEDGILAKKESYNRCCDVCVKPLEEGDDCEEAVDESLESLRNIGASRCKKGLKCLDGKCVLDETIGPLPSVNVSCLFFAKSRKDLRDQGKFSKELWVPECDSAGNFKPTQQRNRNSMCFDEEGNKIFGSGNKKLKNSCACSRHMQKKRAENPFLYIKPQEHCSQTGSFEPLQCINDLCYCADKETGEVIGRMVQREYLHKLRCDVSENENEYLTKCEKEFQRSKNIAYYFTLKGITFHGTNKVECDLDGSFMPLQCDSQKCYCTNKDGKSTKYFEDIELVDNGDISMICNCARDEAASQGPFKCVGYGNYRLLQCFSSNECYCVDDDGDIISKASNQIGRLTEKICKNLLNELKGIHSDDSRETTLPPLSTVNTVGSDPDYTDYYD